MSAWFEQQMTTEDFDSKLCSKWNSRISGLCVMSFGTHSYALIPSPDHLTNNITWYRANSQGLRNFSWEHEIM